VCIVGVLLRRAASQYLLRTQMRPVVTDGVQRGLSVGRSVTRCPLSADSVENHVLEGVPFPQGKEQYFEGEGGPIVKYRE